MPNNLMQIVAVEQFQLFRSYQVKFGSQQTKTITLNLAIIDDSSVPSGDYHISHPTLLHIQRIIDINKVIALLATRKLMNQLKLGQFINNEHLSQFDGVMLSDHHIQHTILYIGECTIKFQKYLEWYKENNKNWQQIKHLIQAMYQDIAHYQIESTNFKDINFSLGHFLPIFTFFGDQIIQSSIGCRKIKYLQQIQEQIKKHKGLISKVTSQKIGNLKKIGDLECQNQKKQDISPTMIDILNLVRLIGEIKFKTAKNFIQEYEKLRKEGNKQQKCKQIYKTVKNYCFLQGRATDYSQLNEHEKKQLLTKSECNNLLSEYEMLQNEGNKSIPNNKKDLQNEIMSLKNLRDRNSKIRYHFLSSKVARIQLFYHRALAHLNKSLELKANQTQNAHLLHQRAICYGKLCLRDKEIQDYSSSLRLKEAIYGKFHGNLLSSLGNMLITYAKTKDLQACSQVLQKINTIKNQKGYQTWEQSRPQVSLFLKKIESYLKSGIFNADQLNQLPFQENPNAKSEISKSKSNNIEIPKISKMIKVINKSFSSQSHEKLKAISIPKEWAAVRSQIGYVWMIFNFYNEFLNSKSFLSHKLLQQIQKWLPYVEKAHFNLANKLRYLILYLSSDPTQIIQITRSLLQSPYPTTVKNELQRKMLNIYKSYGMKDKIFDYYHNKKFEFNKNEFDPNQAYYNLQFYLQTQNYAEYLTLAKVYLMKIQSYKSLSEDELIDHSKKNIRIISRVINKSARVMIGQIKSYFHFKEWKAIENVYGKLSQYHNGQVFQSQASNIHRIIIVAYYQLELYNKAISVFLQYINGKQVQSQDIYLYIIGCECAFMLGHQKLSQFYEKLNSFDDLSKLNQQERLQLQDIKIKVQLKYPNLQKQSNCLMKAIKLMLSSPKSGTNWTKITEILCYYCLEESQKKNKQKFEQSFIQLVSILQRYKLVLSLSEEKLKKLLQYIKECKFLQDPTKIRVYMEFLSLIDIQFGLYSSVSEDYYTHLFEIYQKNNNKQESLLILIHLFQIKYGKSSLKIQQKIDQLYNDIFSQEDTSFLEQKDNDLKILSWAEQKTKGIIKLINKIKRIQAHSIKQSDQMQTSFKNQLTNFRLLYKSQFSLLEQSIVLSKLQVYSWDEDDDDSLI